MKKTKNKLVQGWGINDVGYNVYKYEVIDSKKKIVWACPYYMKWHNMLKRCLYSKFQEKRPTYTGCTIYTEWRHLSNFIKWVDDQPNKDWKNCVLDKDFLSTGNNIYSPKTSFFISRNLNVFITDRVNYRGDYMLGVSRVTDSNKNRFQASCNNPFIGKKEYLGSFLTEIEAHKAWQAKKHEHALKLAEGQDDPRVAKALRERYAPDKDWTNR